MSKLKIGYDKQGNAIYIEDVRKKWKKEAKEKKVELKKSKKRTEKTIKNLVNIIKTKPKKTLFKRDRATIILPTKKAQPILRRSEIFNKEYEREKNLLGWK